MRSDCVRTIVTRSLLVGWAVIFLAAQLVCAQAPASRSDANWFPYQQNWLGADSAYSIPLGKGRTLWLLGDTFVEVKGLVPRNIGGGFIRNSIAISTCVEQDCRFEYYWPGIGTNHPKTMFVVPGTDWLWPLDGFVCDHTLYIAMMQMKAEGTGAFGFNFSAVQLAVIKNYEEPPSQWQISYQKLNSGDLTIPGVTITVPSESVPNPDPENSHGGDYAYFFTLLPAKASVQQQHMGMTRIPLKELGNCARPGSVAWEYLRGDHTWAKWAPNDTSLPADHATLFAPGATEMTVRYHADTKQWLGVYPTAWDKQARYMLSSALLGPWGQPLKLYSYPEMDVKNPNYTPKIFCYAAKEHLELEKPGQLFFTYACNSTDVEEVIKNMNLYYPVVVTQPLPH